jgi:lipopolysaccharide/colanic/teichoic acid biosynthesis glycosyltransferase
MCNAPDKITSNDSGATKMNTKKIISTYIISGMLSLLCAAAGHASITIDGNLDGPNDWGVSLTDTGADIAGYLDNHLHLPTAHGATWVTEDNTDAHHSGLAYVGPEYSPYNYCDAEAIYFKNDATNIYLAVVEGLPINGYNYNGTLIKPGDIAIHVGTGSTPEHPSLNSYDSYYTFGLDILSNNSAELMSVNSWTDGQNSPGEPYSIKGGTNKLLLNSSSFCYSSTDVNGHYVIEAAIPLGMLGLTANSARAIGIEWNMSCGNDYLALNTVTTPCTSVPEPSTFVLFFTGLLGTLVAFMRKRYNEFRRFLDIVISVVGLVIAFPIMLIAAILIKMDSSGPVFYKQVRVGFNRRGEAMASADGVEKRKTDYSGSPFTIYKLRTMRSDAEKSGAVWASQNDSRITRIGNFLRKTRLDEVPQLINVLKGDMAIVGPRPERPVFVKQLSENLNEYGKRHNIKPGITGLAQTRFQYAASFEDTKKKLKYDLLYIRRNCLFMDTKIVFDTIGTVMFAKGR